MNENKVSSVTYVKVYSHRNEKLFRLSLLGDSGIGKTSIISKYVDKTFDNYVMTTLGVDFKTQSFLKDGQLIKLQIWDTAGQERYRGILPSYYRKSQGILLVYDLVQPETANSINGWLEEIYKYTSEGIPIHLVGNKSDLDTLKNIEYKDKIRETREIIARILQSHPNLSNHECSAKTGENIEDIFLGISTEMLHQLNTNIFQENTQANSNNNKNNSNNNNNNNILRLNRLNFRRSNEENCC